MGVLRNIQLGLERYYDLVPFMDVEDCRLQRVGDVGHDRECLMVRTRGDYVELGLFVDPELEERAAEFHGLGGPGLDAWAALVEGVSHFLYVGHCGTFDRRVSLNELEYQAEIDKFLFTAASFAQDFEELSGQLVVLYRQLFFGWSYVGAGDSRFELYRDANRRAQALCARWLEDVKKRQWGLADLQREGRRFYRKNFEGKSRAPMAKSLAP